MPKKRSSKFDFEQETEGFTDKEKAKVKRLVHAHVTREEAERLFPTEPARRDAAITSLYREYIEELEIEKRIPESEKKHDLEPPNSRYEGRDFNRQSIGT